MMTSLFKKSVPFPFFRLSILFQSAAQELLNPFPWFKVLVSGVLYRSTHLQITYPQNRSGMKIARSDADAAVKFVQR